MSWTARIAWLGPVDARRASGDAARPDTADVRMAEWNRDANVHEHALVHALLRQVAMLSTRHGAVAVEEIRVELGPLSGVEPLLVELAFAEQVEQTPCRGARLCIEQVGLEATCRDCGTTFEVEGFRFRCARCGSARVRVIRGDEFRLRDIIIRTAECGEAVGSTDEVGQTPHGEDRGSLGPSPGEGARSDEREEDPCGS